MSVKKRILTCDLYDFACVIAEAIDYVHYYFHNHCKDKVYPFRITKPSKKEVTHKPFYRRFNCLTTLDKWSDVK